MTEADKLRQDRDQWKDEALRLREQLTAASERADIFRRGAEVYSKSVEELRAENEVLKKRLESATEFRFFTHPKHFIFNVSICRCEGWKLPKQPYMWAVRRSGCVLGKDGEWAHEPIPSSRDEEFYAMYRFDTFEEAEAAALKALEVVG